MTFWLVFARCVGFAFRAPGFSHPSVVPAVRAGLAFFLAIALAPGVAAVNLDGFALVLAFATELLVGGAIGMVASLIYDAAYAGGRAVDDYVGVKAIAPNLQLVAPSGFGRVWSLAYTGGFFLLGAYRPTLLAFAQSFARIAPGMPFESHAWGPYVIGFASTILLVALGIAAPAIGLAFVVQIALGALSRAVPRFGSLTLAFPLAFAAALVAGALSVPLLAARAGAPVVSLPPAAR
ncbi:MAG: flagellar biosynthetic protein FliR [Candidatus Eremiobacteraeota bacterium]|nr:flagellar biosynthetic protein FliR [Candidatus Eremiobacteraeota bacterium]MBV8375350.1 flagellar biosynthetic protein FliR [Candidatus Eremiobacteraeota bacterium]